MLRVTLTAVLVLLTALQSQAVAAPSGDEPTSAPTNVAAPKLPSPAAYDVGSADRRGSLLTSLYLSYATMQAVDFHFTAQAVRGGARVVNPMAAPFGGSTGTMLAVKAAGTASTIYLVDRMRRRSRVAAIVTMVAINGVTATMLARNAWNAHCQHNNH